MWRFGASHGNQPIPSSEVLFNILAPGVIEQHYTFGFSRELASGREVSLALMYAPSKEVKKTNPLEAPGRQTDPFEDGPVGRAKWGLLVRAGSGPAAG